jgi:hypothetical protein
MRNCKTAVGPLTDDQKKLRDEFLEMYPNVIALITKIMPQAVRAMMYGRGMSIHEIESIAWMGVMRCCSDEGRGGKKSEAHLHWGMFASSGYSLTDDVDDEDRLQIIRIRVRFALDEMKNNRDRQVVMMRFGIPDGEPKTLEQIGDRIGLTKERVRQLEMRALSVLKPKLESIWNVI